MASGALARICSSTRKLAARSILPLAWVSPNAAAGMNRGCTGTCCAIWQSQRSRSMESCFIRMGKRWSYEQDIFNLAKTCPEAKPKDLHLRKVLYNHNCLCTNLRRVTYKKHMSPTPVSWISLFFDRTRQEIFQQK